MLRLARLQTTSPPPTPDVLAFIEHLNLLTAAPSTSVREFMESDPATWTERWRPPTEAAALNAFERLLDGANDQLDQEPQRALLLTCFVLRQSRTMGVSESSPRLILLFLRGRAWKEHASALRSFRRLRQAHYAIRTAVQLLSGTEAFVSERTAALLLQAHVWHDLGQTTAAIDLVHECADTFADLGDARRCLQAVIFEGIFYFERHDKRAEATFTKALVTAEQLGDQRELARIYNNLGHCAVREKKLGPAAQYFAEALVRFTTLRMDTEEQRARWGIARVLQQSGRQEEALERLHAIQQSFAARGMRYQAARVLIDIATALLELGETKRARLVCGALPDDLVGPEETLMPLAYFRGITARDLKKNDVKESLQILRARLRGLEEIPPEDAASRSTPRILASQTTPKTRRKA